MRLTLRTMLAYLDGIRLKEGEAEELGKKVESSPFATALVHRIRGCTRRLRLAAPPLEGRGLGRDPNTVSEYLDNTLPQDRVPDLEKICLESDAHLAEVASCHQILLLVQSEHMDVSSTLRRRIYALSRPDAHGMDDPSRESTARGSTARGSTAAGLGRGPTASTTNSLAGHSSRTAVAPSPVNASRPSRNQRTATG
jgi:hypothetical protein